MRQERKNVNLPYLKTPESYERFQGVIPTQESSKLALPVQHLRASSVFYSVGGRPKLPALLNYSPHAKI